MFNKDGKQKKTLPSNQENESHSVWNAFGHTWWMLSSHLRLQVSEFKAQGVVRWKLYLETPLT